MGNLGIERGLGKCDPLERYGQKVKTCRLVKPIIDPAVGARIVVGSPWSIASDASNATCQGMGFSKEWQAEIVSFDPGAKYSLKEVGVVEVENLPVCHSFINEEFSPS